MRECGRPSVLIAFSIQSFHKFHQGIYLFLGKIQLSRKTGVDFAVHLRVRFAAFAIECDNVAQRLDRIIVHVWCAIADIP